MMERDNDWKIIQREEWSEKCDYFNDSQHSLLFLIVSAVAVAGAGWSRGRNNFRSIIELVVNYRQSTAVPSLLTPVSISPSLPWLHCNHEGTSVTSACLARVILQSLIIIFSLFLIANWVEFNLKLRWFNNFLHFKHQLFPLTPFIHGTDAIHDSWRRLQQTLACVYDSCAGFYHCGECGQREKLGNNTKIFLCAPSLANDSEKRREK